MREKTNITLHPDIKKQGILLAKREGRSLSEVIERLLEKEIYSSKNAASPRRANTKGSASDSTVLTPGSRGLPKEMLAPPAPSFFKRSRK